MLQHQRQKDLASSKKSSKDSKDLIKDLNNFFLTVECIPVSFLNKIIHSKYGQQTLLLALNVTYVSKKIEKKSQAEKIIFFDKFKKIFGKNALGVMSNPNNLVNLNSNIFYFTHKKIQDSEDYVILVSTELFEGFDEINGEVVTFYGYFPGETFATTFKFCL